MKYVIEFTVEELQFIVDVLNRTPLPYETTSKILPQIAKQVKNQEEAMRNPVSTIINNKEEQPSYD